MTLQTFHNVSKIKIDSPQIKEDRFQKYKTMKNIETAKYLQYDLIY